MKARIYQPSKTAMQSGRAKTGYWLLEFELNSARVPEPLMGWVSSADTNNQVRIKFESCDRAISFAQEKGLDFTVLPAHIKKQRPRNYGDNFRYIPPEDQESA